MAVASLSLKNRPPSSDIAALDMTCFKMLETTRMDPLEAHIDGFGVALIGIVIGDACYG